MIIILFACGNKKEIKNDLEVKTNVESEEQTSETKESSVESKETT